MDAQQQQQQQQQRPGGKQPKNDHIVKCLSQFFKRELISIPLIKKYPHQSLAQRCAVRAATLEFDTAAYPNIDYVAGARLNVYAPNSNDHVVSVMRHIIDDLHPKQTIRMKGAPGSPPQPLPPSSDPLVAFSREVGDEALQLALTYLYDITVAPSRDLLRIMADNCSQREQKAKLIQLSSSDEIWEKWICTGLRTLKSTFDEFNSCNISAKSLLSELSLQQPRQYSISSIKSSQRFRTEVMVFQHRFSNRLIAQMLTVLKDREALGHFASRSSSPDGTVNRSFSNSRYHQATSPPVRAVARNDKTSSKSRSSMRSLRSMAAPFGSSPISTQQVHRIPSYSGPMVSLYAASSISSSTTGTNSTGPSPAKKLAIGALNQKATRNQPANKNTASPTRSASSSSHERPYEGLCSSYLLDLKANERVICEFVENPRFTLKGNRERPIMMIGQDIGLVAFRPFWQQRSLEHDRAQVFYTMFKDLMPKKFGDMQLVAVTGNKCRIEDLFKRELNAVVTGKVISSMTNIHRSQLIALLDRAALAGTSSPTSGNPRGGPRLAQLELGKEVSELGKRIFRLLVEQNGCLYTCCDSQITQAIEILLVESVARNSKISRETIMQQLLPKWKGRKLGESVPRPLVVATKSQNLLFTLENKFERAQIVQEIYDHSI